MLSKKMAFSLMSLITIFALAFVAPSAMAGFGASFNVNDISFAGGNQVARGGTVLVHVHFDHVVTAKAADDAFAITADLDNNVDILNSYGSVIDVVENVVAVGVREVDPLADEVNQRNDGKNYTLTITLTQDQIPGEGEVIDKNDHAAQIRVFLAADKVDNADPNSADKNNKIDPFVVDLVGGVVDPTLPLPVSIALSSTLLVPDAGFKGATFDVIVTLSEQPKENAFPASLLTVAEGAASAGVYLGATGIPDETDDTDGYVSDVAATGRDGMHHQYLVTITPTAVDGNTVIKLNAFEDQERYLYTAADITGVGPNKWSPDPSDFDRGAGVDTLTVKINRAVAAAALAAGHEVKLKNKRVIPAGGYLIVATATGDTGINLPDAADADDNTPKIDKRSPAELKYNAISVALPNLEAFLGNGGTLDLVSPDAGLVISEIMWGSDASLKVNSNSQWIEIHNTTAADIKTGDGTHKFIFYGPNETVPAKTAAVAATATTKAVPAALPAGVVDRVGTIDDKGGYWSLAGKGQSGRTGFGEDAADLTAIIPTQNLISMYRVMVPSTDLTALAGAMMPAYGNMAASWMSSTPPSVNMDPAKGGNRIASPGADRLITAAEAAATIAAEAAASAAAAAAAAAAADTSVSMPKNGTIYISEVMFAGGGTLPQWIEISNGSRSEEVNLSGWTLTVENATADADVSVGSKAVFTIPEGTMIDPSGQHATPSTILVVTEQGRNNVDGSGQILNLWTAQQTELILLGVTKRRYSLLSDMAFQITLAPPVPIVAPVAATPAPTTAAGIAAARAAAAAKKAADATAALVRKQATDVVGNLGTAGTATWALPMDEGARSSIIRRHVQVSIGAAEPEDGMMMDSWALASDTSFAQVTHIRVSSYYGSADDVGTPGFRAGGALPVELSHFRPARDKVTGAVVITWSTQSELNNAGFFIKRSQQRDGEFKVINATMIAGAGTTSEKQFYTYQDTTAQPNVVYYYQIEDVSLDGNRQTLTNGIRLKGHVSVAGKLTTLWGDLKTSQ